MNRKETEAYVLGMILIKEDFLRLHDLQPEHFLHKPYRIIASALAKIKESPENFNTMTLINYLKMTNELDLVGGEPEIVGLQINLPNEKTQDVLAKAINLLANSEGDFSTNQENLIEPTRGEE